MDEKEITVASYEAFLAEKKLMGSKCKKCSALYLPARAICPGCRDSELEWVPFGTKGKLAAFTCISVPPTWMAAEGYGRNEPYCSGIVEMEEGPRISARILGVEAKNPESITVGTPVTLEILERKQGDQTIPYLAFRAEKTC